MLSTKHRKSNTNIITLVDLNPRINDEVRVEPGEDNMIIKLKVDNQCTNMGTFLTPFEAENIFETLTRNVDLFGWTTIDMPGVDLLVMCHKLSIYCEARPISQKNRKLDDEKRQVGKKEVKKLLEVSFITKAKYTMWLVNVFMVKKLSEKGKMCTDYTDVNKACPKVTYHLSSIDKLVNKMTDNRIIRFLDAYLGYNHIQMYQRTKKKLSS